MKRLRKLLIALALACPMFATAPTVALAQDSVLLDQGPANYSADLIARAQARATTSGEALLSAQAAPGVPGSWRVGMTTVGRGHFVGIRVSFPAAEDGGEPAMAITSKQTLDNFVAAFNGGNAGELAEAAPFDSLHAYYERASYGRLDLTMVTAVDYMAKHNRSYYTGRPVELFYEAMAGIDDTVDFSACDANDDGYIDGVFLQFAGELTGWGSTWWPSMRTIDTPPAGYEGPTTFDGKTPCGAVVVGSAEDTATIESFIGTLCHETGHVLGLPDLYSYSTAGDKGLRGLRVVSLMNSNSCDIDAYSKWMLGWIDDADITRVYVSGDGIDVRRGDGAVEHHDGALTETLSAIENGGGAGAPGFMAISGDQSILDSSLFCDFYLVHYAQKIKNDDEPWGRGIDGDGFRVFRVQGELYPSGSFVHDNTQSGAHEQLIEGLTDLDRYNVGRIWAAGDAITPDTSPSTNFGESTVTGFTGIVLDFKKTGGATGELAVSYADPKPAEPLTVSYTGPEAISNRTELTFKLSRSVPRNKEVVEWPQLLVDGKPCGSNVTLYDAGSMTLTYTVQVELSAFTASSKLQFEIPAGYFVLGYDAKGQPKLSDAYTVDLPAAKTYELAVSGTYASIAGGGAVSDVVETGGAQRFLAFNGFAADAGRLLLCTLATDGRSCSAVDVSGVALPGDSFGSMDVIALDGGVLFCRLTVSQAATAVTGLWIDAASGAVLASCDMGAQREPEQVELVRIGDDVASIYRASDGGWTLNVYRRSGGTVEVESASLAGFGPGSAVSIVGAGAGYSAALPATSYGGERGVVGLWKAKGPAAEFCQGEPDIRIAIDQLSAVNAVYVSGERVYVQALLDRMVDGQDNFVNVLLIYNLKGNLLRSTDIDGLPYFPSNARMRVSNQGAIAFLVDETGDDGDMVGRIHMYLFDNGCVSRGEGYAYARGAGFWLGEQWIALDWGQSRDETETVLNWYLSTDLGGEGPVDPVDPVGPTDPGAPSGSGKGGVRVKKAIHGGTLANTGDRARAIVAAIAGIGAIAIAVGAASSQRRAHGL